MATVSVMTGIAGSGRAPSARGSLLLMMVLAWVAGSVPLVGAVLDWFVTYFHEISHALVSVATGGRVERLALLPNGSGFVLSSGGARVATLLAGYAGAFLWGALLYRLGRVGHVAGIGVALGLLAFMVLTGVAWVVPGDLGTYAILAIMMAVLAGGLWQGDRGWARTLVMFLGVYVLVRGLDLALDLHGVMGMRRLPEAARHNDAVFLAQATGVAPRVWTFAWVAFGGLVIYRLWRWAAVADARVGGSGRGPGGGPGIGPAPEEGTGTGTGRRRARLRVVD
ncbi:M50 family metallopeptidase [Rhodothalassium salexigens]|nr:M50 family metallopeptidase [Rhodothalassium salexigens]MBB4210397.1 hypothetical protein [Rhodothalassium salexigens DSM 2132]